MNSSPAAVTEPIVNAMTVDVEDYFQVSAFESHFTKRDWTSIPCRVEANVEKILSLFDERGIHATFFTLGWMADRYPAMIKRIAAAGHELASHGWEHVRVVNQTEAVFRRDVLRSKNLLEDVSGSQVKGYRAASYSINANNLWAIDVLRDVGYQYSSSIVPVHHDLYGMPEAPRFAFRWPNGLLEIPVSTLKLGPRNLNCGGGGWFRFYPYWFSQWALMRINRCEQQPCMFYFHPWEIDPSQPRVQGLSAKTRFRHYINLHKTYPRLQALLESLEWDRVDRVFPYQGQHYPQYQRDQSEIQKPYASDVLCSVAGVR